MFPGFPLYLFRGCHQVPLKDQAQLRVLGPESLVRDGRRLVGACLPLRRWLVRTLWWLGTGFVAFKKYNWLVVWNMNFYDFPYIGKFIIPTDEIIFFRGVGQPPTRQGGARVSSVAPKH